MGAIASQITSLTIVYLTVYSGADQRKHQSCASLAFVRGIHRWPVNSPLKWPVTRKCFHLMTSSWLIYSAVVHWFHLYASLHVWRPDPRQKRWLTQNSCSVTDNGYLETQIMQPLLCNTVSSYKIQRILTTWPLISVTAGDDPGRKLRRFMPSFKTKAVCSN